MMGGWDSGGQQEATESVNLVSEVPDSAPGTPQPGSGKYIHGSAMPWTTVLHFPP